MMSDSKSDYPEKSFKVYGSDPAVKDVTENESKINASALLGFFGMKQQNSAFVALITKGDTIASVVRFKKAAGDKYRPRGHVIYNYRCVICRLGKQNDKVCRNTVQRRNKRMLPLPHKQKRELLRHGNSLSRTAYKKFGFIHENGNFIRSSAFCADNTRHGTKKRRQIRQPYDV